MPCFNLELMYYYRAVHICVYCSYCNALLCYYTYANVSATQTCLKLISGWLQMQSIFNVCLASNLNVKVCISLHCAGYAIMWQFSGIQNRYISHFQPGVRGTLGFPQTLLGVPWAMADWPTIWWGMHYSEAYTTWQSDMQPVIFSCLKEWHSDPQYKEHSFPWLPM